MYSATVLIVSLVSFFVSAAVLSPSSSLPDNGLRAPRTLPSLLLPSNITNTSFPSSNVLRIQCDASHYGRNLNPSSCRDVFTYIAKSDDQQTFSERHTSQPNNVPLPLRLLSDDGKCFIQPLLLHGAVTGKASITQIAQAGHVLFQRCVVDRGIGGIAADIGGDNHLNVVITDYEPRVRCDRTATPAPPYESCLVIIADMLASKERKVFGKRSLDSRVEANLPTNFKSIDARCKMTVDITGKSTSASWYEIWEAAAALVTMCVRAQSKGGKAFGMGLRKNIFVHVSDENPDLSQPAAEIASVSALAPLLGIEASNVSSSQAGESEWAPVPFVEVSTGLVQNSSSLSLISSDGSADELEDSSA